MKSVRAEGCHVGLFREFVRPACCTYGQSDTTSGSSCRFQTGVSLHHEAFQDYYSTISLFGLITKETLKFHIPGLLLGSPPVPVGFSSQRVSNTGSVCES